MTTDTMNLTAAEQRLVNALRGPRIDTIWSRAIQHVLDSEDVDRLHELARELQDQNRDNPALMKKILGGAYVEVMNFKAAAANS